MVPGGSAGVVANGSPVPAHRRHLSRPSVTKEEIQKAKHMIVEAEKMVDDAIDTHISKAFRREQTALEKIEKSAEFQAQVLVFRQDLVSISDPFE